jgi:hypothetical protein
MTQKLTAKEASDHYKISICALKRWARLGILKVEKTSEGETLYIVPGTLNNLKIPFYVDDFFYGLDIQQYKTKDECLKKVCENECEEIVSYYNYKQVIPVPDKSQWKYENKRPYFDIRLEPDEDIISDFKCNVDYELTIGGNPYKNINRIVQLCLGFHEVRIKMYLDESSPKEIVLSYNRYHFPRELRRDISVSMNWGGLYDGDLVYMAGMAGYYNKDRMADYYSKNI